MQRIVGVDTARGLAILGMFVAHLGLVRDQEMLSPTGWFFIADGRPSALFALLAGVGLAFMTRRAWRDGDPLEWARQRVRIVKRAGVLYLLGWVLTLLGTPVAVILPSYAVMFACCLPFLRLRPRALVAWAIGIATVMQFPVLAARAALGAASGWRLVPGLGEVLTGYYPALIWVAYLLVGLAVGRLDLRAPGTAVALVSAGAALAFLGYGAGWAVRSLVQPNPDTFAGLVLSIEPHTDSALELAGNAGVGIAVVGTCLLLTRSPVLRVILTPVSAAGAMALTVYSLQIVYIRILGSDAVWYPESNLPLLWLVLGAFLVAMVWQRLLGPGPFERALHAVIRTPPSMHPLQPREPYPSLPRRRQ